MHYIDVMQYGTAAKMNELSILINRDDSQKHSVDQIKTSVKIDSVILLK